MAVAEDRRRLGVRLTFLQVGVVAIFAALAIAFWFLQIVQNAKFEEMAENNHQRTLALRAPRGVLFDRHGKVLVENRLSFSVSIVREHTKDIDRTIRLLAAVAGLDERYVRQIVDRHRGEPTYRPIVIIEDASLAQVAAITARRLDFELPDVDVAEVPTRQIPDRRAGGASLRLRRRSERCAGRQRNHERVDHRSVGRREDLQPAADGPRRRQACRRQQHGARDPHAREDFAGRRTAGAAHDRLRPAEGGRGRVPACGLQRRGPDPRPAGRRCPVVCEPARRTTRTTSPRESIASRGPRSIPTSSGRFRTASSRGGIHPDRPSRLSSPWQRSKRAW